MPDFNFNLGDEVKDKITGFKGIVSTRSQWLHQCNTYGVKSKKLQDGKPITSQWFDEPQLELVKEKVHKASRKTGGPRGSVPTPGRM